MSGDIAIKLQGVKKQYRLGQIGGGTLQGDLQSWWARKRGKEDPKYLKVRLSVLSVRMVQVRVPC